MDNKIITPKLDLGKSVNKLMWCSVWSSVDNSMYSSVHGSVYSSVSSSVYISVRRSVDSPIRSLTNFIL